MEWVSVKDRLPPKEALACLVFNADERHGNGIVDIAEWWITDWQHPYGGTADVTHWMPLPSPPQESEGE